MQKKNNGHGQETPPFLNQNFFQFVVQNVEHFAIFAFSRDGRVESWNPGVETILGYASEEFLGKDFSIIYTPEDIAARVPLLEEREAETRGRGEDQRWHLRKDGSRFWGSGLLMPLADERGETIGYVKILRDDTARKLTENALREKERLYRAAVENFPNGAVFIFDRALLCVVAGGRETAAGEPERALVGKPIGEAFASAAAVARIEPICRAALRGESGEAEIEDDGGIYKIFYAPVEDGVSVGAEAEYGMVLTRNVTDERRAAEQIERLSRHNAAILDSITDAFFSLDREWRFTYANREAEKLLFRGGTELLGKCVWDEFPEAVGSTFYKEYHRAVESGQSVAFEEYYPPLNAWFDVRAYPSAAGLSVYFHNVNERKESERELRESAAKLRLALESGGMGWWNYDPLTNRSEPDEKCLAMFGIAPADYAGNAAPLFDAIYPEDRERVRREITEAIETRGVYHTEFRVLRPADGETRWLAGIGRVTYDEKNGLPQQMYGVNFDVTERRQTEEILRRSEERFRGLQQATPDGFMIFESARDEQTGAIKDFRWVYVNPAAEKIVGRSERDLIGKRLLEEMPGNREEGLFDAYVRVVETGEVWRKEFSYAHEGLDHYFLSTAVKTGDGFAVAFSDITERRRAEREREELLAKEQAARAQAESAIRAKDEFLAVVTHELRSPLNAILGWNAMLQKQSSPEMLARVTEIIDRQGRQQLQLIEDLLDTARVVSGKMKIEQQPVDLSPVITSALDVVSPAAQSKNVSLSLTIGKSCIVTGDPDRLQQIVWNLLSNAVKFTPEGGRVEIELSRRDPFAVIIVRDNGKGIEPEFLPFVFDRFSQADSTKSRRFGGLGLGLSLVKQLTELHGGSIEVESEGDGRGATFTVKLPIRAVGTAKNLNSSRAPDKKFPTTIFFESETEADAKTESAFESASAQDRIEAGGKKRLAGARILVADDLEDARDLVALTFTSAGAFVEAYASGAEALAVFANGAGDAPGAPFDLFVCDIGMPDEDGYAVIEKLRRIEKAHGGGRVPAIALTAFSGSRDKRRALESGFDMHVSKPVEPEDLILTAESLLSTVRGV